MSVDQFKEAKEANQKWKYSCSERTSESWRKVEATAIWDSSLQKIESRVLIDKSALMIVHVISGWLASSYPIRRAFLQHISWRVSSNLSNKRKSFYHFTWKNGLIAVWMFVHPTEYGGDIALKSFLISQKFYQHQNITIIIKGESETYPNFWNCHVILSLKFIGSFEAAVLSF